MKERDEIRYKPGSVNLSKFKFGGIPIGFLLEKSTKAAPDPETQNGLDKARAAVRDKGIIILDPHYGNLDVFFSGLNILKELEINKCVIPASIKILNDPIVKTFVNDLRKIDGMEIYPTYRDAKHVSEEEKELYKDMTKKERDDKNSVYVTRALEILPEPKSMVFVAAYGGLNPPSDGKIPHGVAKILRTGNPALCTLSIYGKRFLPVTTYTSENLLYFTKKSLNQDMFMAITEEHKKIARRTGFNENYFNI